MKRFSPTPWTTLAVLGVAALAGCNQTRPTRVTQLTASQPATVVMHSGPQPTMGWSGAQLVTQVVYQQPGQVVYQQPASVMMPAQPMALTTGVVQASVQQPAGNEQAIEPVQYQTVPTGYPRAETPVGRRSFVDITASSCYGHAEDYTWLRGEVEYSRLSNGYRIRYASVDEVDRHGGSAVLAGNVNGLKDGQHVQVQGRMQDASELSTRPTFRVDAVQVLDAGK